MQYLPIKLKRTINCERCGQQTPLKEVHCVHCHGANEAQLAAIKKEHEERLSAGAELGKGFAIVAAIIVIIMCIFIFNL